MLESFYNSYGFLGSITIAFLIFLAFIFWMAGIAGISQLPESRKKNFKLLASVVFPPYTIVWLFIDMWRQRRLMKEKNI